MPCCLFYCHLASQLDPKPFKQVVAFWFSSTKKEYFTLNPTNKRSILKKLKFEEIDLSI